jgi:hypothetical protein
MPGPFPDDRMERQRQQFEQNFGFAPTRENVRENVTGGLADADWIEYPLTEAFDWPSALDGTDTSFQDVDMIVAWTFENLSGTDAFPLESREAVVDALVEWLEDEGVFE